MDWQIVIIIIASMVFLLFLTEKIISIFKSNTTTTTSNYRVEFLENKLNFVHNELRKKDEHILMLINKLSQK